jgi:hypothetical protein
VDIRACTDAQQTPAAAGPHLLLVAFCPRQQLRKVVFDGGVCDHAPHRLLADWIVFHQTEAELGIWLKMLLNKYTLQQQTP